MKLHNHVIMEPPRGRYIWYPRWFFHLHRGPEYGDGPILDGHLEFVLSKPTPEFGIHLSVGTRGSETPWDGYFKVAGTTLYWGIQQGGSLAEKVTQLWLNRLPDRVGAACLDNTCDCPPYNPGATFKRHLGRNGEASVTAPDRAEDRASQAARGVTDQAMQLWMSAFAEGMREGMAIAATTLGSAAGALPAGMARVGGTVMSTEQVVDLLMNLRDRILMQAHAIEDPEPPTVGDPR